jgi:ribose 5-phosphate isomerase B
MYQGTLYICADHRGYGLKKRLLRYFENELGIKVEDFGPFEYNEEDDYTDFVFPAAEKTVHTNGRLIACCGTSSGEVIAANKVRGMRMITAYNIESAALGVTKNNANGIALAADVLTDDHAMAIVKKYLETTEFLGGKYERRNEKIREYEMRKLKIED